MTVRYALYQWYNPQGKHYYLTCPDTFDGFCISSHLSAHYGNAFSAILNETSKPYFIDPETVAFQTFDLDIFFNDNDNLRMSWEKLLVHYPSLIKDIIISRRPLTISDFIINEGNFTPLLYELVSKVISFQQKIIEERFLDLSYFMDIRPTLQFIVSPYFYFNSIGNDWYKINMEILNEFNTIEIDNHKYAVLCFNKNILLEENNVEQLSADFLKDNIDGYLLWINNFDETNEQTIYYNNFLKLIHKLSNDNKIVINLYGSYFSILSSYWGMSGHASGINSKDSMDVNVRLIRGGPQGGPIPRYYIPDFHTRVVIDQGVRLIRQFGSLQCTCPVCRNNMHGYDPSIDRREGRRIMNEHFLYIRNSEKINIENNSYVDIFTNIDRSYRQYSNNRSILPISHLRSWVEAINQNLHLL